MSTTDRLLLLLHIGFAIFTLGPLTAATMATPRYIRKRDAVVVRYLNRNTRIYGLGTLGILLVGLLMGRDRFDEVWLTVAVTLFVVALVLLFIVERDQRKSAGLLEAAAADRTVPAEGDETAGNGTSGTETSGKKTGGKETVRETVRESEIAQVERGRITAISGVVALLWLVILTLMVWNG